ncbi:glycosyl hydrolase family 8 [Liquorilactobacillus satsumensis]|uniref:Glucanase n=1 Tax=Liquorilactobacillus satsumensis DSM 16230 = JCM 12392 TaxID=1423801 RepID=A0A0R1UVK4_9LACO|nr:glycosyl hydrolase family 8 [Liquorilactobacillus satsumensis]KRL97143.1 glycoside hydrolase family protein [Liquorilactobacillus satsumensis DSM 16230 = JCM 12392]
MKKTLIIYFSFISILIAFIWTVVFVRTNSAKYLKKNIYEQWRTAFLVTNKNQAYIQTNNSQHKVTVLSEGQGYGLLLTVKAAKNGYASQPDFNRLFNYYLKNRDEGTQLMSWKQVISKKRTVKFKNNATDGDLYIAYSLLQAAKIWPQSAALYRKQANKLLSDILKYDYNTATGCLTVGNWATGSDKYSNLLRTSDTLPAQFDEFYRFTDDPTWLTIKKSMLQQLQRLSAQHATGLLPDFAWIKHDGKVVAAKAQSVSVKYRDDGYYSYNACRLPYNLAQSKDKHAQLVLRKMMKFFMKQEYITGGYQLNGKKLNDYQSASFAAPILYAAMQNSQFYKLVQQEKYIFMQKVDPTNYYQATIVTLTAIAGL